MKQMQTEVIRIGIKIIHEASSPPKVRFSREAMRDAQTNVHPQRCYLASAARPIQPIAQLPAEMSLAERARKAIPDVIIDSQIDSQTKR